MIKVHRLSVYNFCSILIKPCVSWQKIAACIAAAFLFSLPLSTSAVEWGIELHQGAESDEQGYSFTLSDSFSRKSNFYWTLGYYKLDDVAVKWNGGELLFPIETVDALLSYRFSPRSFNGTSSGFAFEFKAGLSLSIKENKFYWPELEEEKYFSESNDINAVIAAAIHYKFNRNTAMQLGIKSYPSFSEFDDSINSAFVGFSHQFGNRQYGL